jgi:hypothetical protein
MGALGRYQTEYYYFVPAAPRAYRRALTRQASAYYQYICDNGLHALFTPRFIDRVAGYVTFARQGRVVVTDCHVGNEACAPQAKEKTDDSPHAQFEARPGMTGTRC